MKMRTCFLENSSSPDSRPGSSIPKSIEILNRGCSGVSVVTWVVRAKFFTSPQASPSGVSEGQSIPHCEGWSALGPLTLRVFSTYEFILVIIPRELM